MHTNRGYIKNLELMDKDRRKDKQAGSPQKRRSAKKKFKLWSRRAKGEA